MMSALAIIGLVPSSTTVAEQGKAQSNEAEEKEHSKADVSNKGGDDKNGADQVLDVKETKLDQDDTKEAGKGDKGQRGVRGKGASAQIKRRKADEEKKTEVQEESGDHDKGEAAGEADKSQANNAGAEGKERQRGKRVTPNTVVKAATEHEEKDRLEGKKEEQGEAEEKVGSGEDRPRAARNKRKAPATATPSPKKRVGKKVRQGEGEPVPLDTHDMVPAGKTRPLHPRVLEFVQWEDDTARLRRAHTKRGGSSMLNAVLMGMANGVNPTSEDEPAVRRRLKAEIEKTTKEAWNSLAGECDGQCSTPQEYTRRFLSQPDAFLDRSILYFCLQLKDALPPHPLPCLIYCITVQPLLPDTRVEDSDDISARILDKADTAIRVHSFGQLPTSLSTPVDCIVLYQLWGVTQHVELVVHGDGPLTRFPHDHPFIVALGKQVSSRSDHIDFARDNSFECAPLQGWKFPCLLEVDFLPVTSSSSSTTDDPASYSKLPVVQRILTNVRRDLDRSDRRFLKYLVALSHISRIDNDDKRQEEYSRVAHFLNEYESCNMSIILGCIVISFFIYATPHVGKWFQAQKRVTLKMLASCPVDLVRDEYRLRLLFLHLVHNKAIVKRDDIMALATRLIADDDISIKGGWDIDEETYEFTFLVIHTTGETEDDERVLKHEYAWWPQSKLMEDKHWRKLVETKIKAVRSLTIKELGNKVRRGKNGGQDQLCVMISGAPQHPLWWTRDQMLHHKVKQWKEKLDEFEAQKEEKAGVEEKVEPAVDSKDTVISKLRADLAKEKAAREKERLRGEKAEQALKERVETEQEQIKTAKQSLAAERNEIAQRKQQLDKREAKIEEWLKAHPEAGTLVDV